MLLVSLASKTCKELEKGGITEKRFGDVGIGHTTPVLAPGLD